MPSALADIIQLYLTDTTTSEPFREPSETSEASEHVDQQVLVDLIQEIRQSIQSTRKLHQLLAHLLHGLVNQLKITLQETAT